MSRSTRRRPLRKSQPKLLSRRSFLGQSGASLTALGLAPLLPACDGGNGGRSPDGGAPDALAFLHGVASGDPLSDRVILWTRVTQTGTAAVPVTVRLSTQPDFSSGVTVRNSSATPERDFTVKIDAAGLQPGTTYYYQFEARGQRSPVGRTRTLPVDAVDRLRIAVLSCASLAHGFFNAYARVAERADLDLVLHLGDYLYEYGNGEYGSVRTYEPPTEIVSLEDYRARHGQYKRDPDLQAVHRQHPLVCVWDDHESTNDSWRDGAENHQPEIEGPWPLRKSIAQQVYEEWMPIRVSDPGVIYRRFPIGSLVNLHMLDTRLLARSEQLSPSGAVPGLPVGVFTATGAFADPARTLLGEAQEAWLADGLRSSTATWQLLGQQVMFGQLQVLGLPRATGLSQFLNPDQWDGYPAARDRLLDVIRGGGGFPAIDNCIVLTGDIHTSWAMNISEDPNNLLAYNPLTGIGSRAVEFVTTSVTSPGLESLAPVGDVLRLNNPHIRYVDLASKGYLLLDITPERCIGEFWAVDGIATRGGGERFQAAFQVRAGTNRLSEAAQTSSRANAPPLAS